METGRCGARSLRNWAGKPVGRREGMGVPADANHCIRDIMSSRPKMRVRRYITYLVRTKVSDDLC